MTFKIWNTVKFSDAFSIPLQSVTEDVTPLSGTEAHRKLLSLSLFSIILSWCLMCHFPLSFSLWHLHSYEWDEAEDLSSLC